MLTVDFSPLHSGLARTFGRAAFARPAPVARRAFQPKANGFPSLARFASSEAASTGKIHQVIGAVVDGTLVGYPRKKTLLSREPLRENLFFIAKIINNDPKFIENS